MKDNFMRMGFVTLGLVMLASQALANDTTATLGAGGLAFVQNGDISMMDEKLFISMDKVTVDYIFHNNATSDVETYVAFPFPDVTGSMDMNVNVPDFESDNFLNFKVSQDGKPIAPNLQQRAYSLGLDVTDDLVKAGVPLLPFGDKTTAALDKLDPVVADDWIKRGILLTEEYDDGKGMKKYGHPMWTLKSAYWWKAKFPAGKDVAVSHSYKTGTGSTVAVTYYDGEGKIDQARFDQYTQKYCLDKAFQSAVESGTASIKKAGGFGYTENWVSYILTTGANWAGTIGHFTLTVDKGAAGNLISFCGEGVKKIGPTTFQLQATDFYPEKDIDILILTPPPQ